MLYINHKENLYMIKDGFLYLAALIFAAAVLVNLPKIFKGKKAQVFFNFAPPIVILVDFQPFFEKKDDIYTDMWNRFQVDSLHAYGDYDEASMFSYAAGKVVESFYRYNLTETDKVVYQAHEWMTGMGALYVQEAVPEVATIFKIGRAHV